MELLPLAGPEYDVPDQNGCSALMYTALNGLEHAAEFLLEKRANINRLGHCPEVCASIALRLDPLILA